LFELENADLWPTTYLRFRSHLRIGHASNRGAGMTRHLDNAIRLWLAIAVALPGCALRNGQMNLSPDDDLPHYRSVALDIEYPDDPAPSNPQTLQNLSPDSVGQDGPTEYWDVKLEEAMQTAFDNSTVLRDLGATLLRTPAVVRSIQNPSITESDPRFGVEAALSEFDAQFATRVLTEKNNRAVNNVFFGGGTTQIKQDLAVFQEQISKRGAAGTQLAIRHNTTYDANNEPGNTFPSAWDTNIEMEARQPMLKDAGVMFNRIQGPNGVAGFANGVLIARINTDTSLAEFEAGVRDFASNVENSYWDLYLAYRDLDAKIRARDASLESWRRIHALFTAGRAGGEAEKEAQAREQYFQFQEEVQNSLAGRLIDGTQTYNGSNGGTQRQIPGVRVAERRLRLLMGLPASDGRLIRPADEPQMAKLIFDWESSLQEALTRRVELRRQRWQIKRRELELIASKNYLKPNLDLVGLYRWRGFGHDLIDPNSNIDGEFSNSYKNLLSGNFQEWQLGAEFNMPIGFRRGHAAVRNAELLLARERCLLNEQERNVTNDLTNVMAEVERSYTVSQTAYNRRQAAVAQLKSMEAAYEADQVPFFMVLDSQRRLADSETRFSLAQVEYALAIKNVHFEKGSLLDYNQIFLSEGPWPGKAYCDATRLKPQSRLLDYTIEPCFFSRGPIEQGAGPLEEATAPSTDANTPATLSPADQSAKPLSQ
jgi:outer membrane protein TolC